MVRYIREDELYHYGTLGMKWGKRRYQYEDGNYTPLGRIHYGIGQYKNMTPGEKLLAVPKAAIDTAAGYGIVKYKKTTKTVNGTSLDKARYAKQQKADEKRANEAYKKRQELKAKAKEEKEKLKQIYAEQKQKQEEAFRKQQEENAKKNQEREQQQEEFIKKQTEEIDKKRAEDKSQKNRDKAKQGDFSDFSNEDLKAYTDRVRLESEARKVMNDAKRAKMDIPRQVAEQIVSYGATGIRAYEMYKNVMFAINDFKQSKVPQPTKTQTPVQLASMNILNNFIEEYNEKDITDPDTAESMKVDLYKQINLVEALSKLYSATQEPQNKNNNNNQKNKNKN